MLHFIIEGILSVLLIVAAYRLWQAEKIMAVHARCVILYDKIIQEKENYIQMLEKK